MNFCPRARQLAKHDGRIAFNPSMKIVAAPARIQRPDCQHKAVSYPTAAQLPAKRGGLGQAFDRDRQSPCRALNLGGEALRRCAIRQVSAPSAQPAAPQAKWHRRNHQPGEA